MNKYFLIEDAKTRGELIEMYYLFHEEIEIGGEPLLAEDKHAIEQMAYSVGKHDDNWGFIIYDYCNKPSGFILCKRHDKGILNYIRPNDVEIESFVKEGKRGNGLGILLKEIAIGSISKLKNGPARAISFVERSNGANIRLLEKTGFSKIRDSKRSHLVYAKEII